MANNKTCDGIQCKYRNKLMTVGGATFYEKCWNYEPKHFIKMKMTYC